VEDFIISGPVNTYSIRHTGERITKRRYLQFLCHRVTFQSMGRCMYDSSTVRLYWKYKLSQFDPYTMHTRTQCMNPINTNMSIKIIFKMRIIMKLKIPIT
jgi:hypothetical protein